MSKLSEKVIDYCLDKSNSTDEDLIKGVQSILGISKSEEPVPDNTKESALEAFGISKEQIHESVDLMNEILIKHKRAGHTLSQALSEIANDDRFSKTLLVVMLDNSNKTLMMAMHGGNF